MTFEHYWLLLTKQWKLIVACILVGALGTYIGSRLMTPIYQSTVLVRVVIHSTSNSADYNNLLASDQLVQTEAQLAVSGPVLAEVVSHYPGVTIDQLTAATTTASRLNTQLFEINVQDADPSRAAMLANDIAATLIKQQVHETQQDNGRSQQQFQQEIDATRQRIEGLTTEITRLQQQITSLEFKKGPQAEIANLQIQVASKQSQLNGLQDHYSKWQTSLLQLELIEAQSNDFLRIAQPAQPSMYPVKPQILLNTVAGLVLGLLLGLLMALLFEQLDTRIRTPEALSQVLSWPVLGTIWRAEKDKGETRKRPAVLSKKHNINTEPYRILRTNIGFSVVQKPIRTLMITSSLPSDGKSTVAINLAIFMAKAGKKTLLVDADLRRPALQKEFMLATDQMGLSNAILAFSQVPPTSGEPRDKAELQRMSLDNYIHSVDIPNLLVMPAGPLPPNPPELLGSKAMDSLLAAISKTDIEIIIFDTAPILGLSDTGTLLPKVDGTLLVVDIMRAKKKTLKQTKDFLSQADVRVLGCVVNKQHSTRRDMPYYYYYHTDGSVDSEQEGNASQNGHSPVLFS
jgi:tyrosine-protein kinase